MRARAAGKNGRRVERRTLLRGLALGGVAVTLPLPRLDAMLNDSGTAYAAGEALPQRFVLWFFGNGILFPRWNPSSAGTGDQWTLSEELAPLTPVKSQLAVVSGLGIKSPIEDDPHVAGAAGALTGASALLKDQVNASIGRRVNTVQLPSIDQIIAQSVPSGRFRSIELGLSKASDPDIEGTLYHNVSHAGPDAPNPPEYDPRAAFNRLFSGMPASPDPGADLLARAKGSVLDAVLADAASLRSKLGSVDQGRLDQHMDAVRALELRLKTPAQVATSCTAPAMPTLGPDSNQQATRERNTVVAELITMALACDATRVVSYMFAAPAAHVYLPDAQLDHDFHNYYNHDAAQQEGVHQGVIFEMTCFADFLQRAQAQAEGAGSLLDSTVVFATSEVSSGLRHEHVEFPVLFAGKGGGKLRGDLHVRLPDDNYTKALVTCAKLMGVDTPGIGKDGGFASEAISELMA